MREKEHDSRLPITQFFVLLATCFVLAAGALMYIGESRRYVGTRPELLNVWYGEHNNEIKFAADGTALGYIDGQSPQFFRWSESNGTLRIYFEPRDKPLLMIAGQFLAELFGRPSSSESYRIESMTRDTMTLVDSNTGDEIRFRTAKPMAK